MRLLPVGADHVRFGSACGQLASERCRHRRCDVWQHLPLWDLCAHSRGDQAGRAIHRTWRLTMVLNHLTSRRGFLKAGAAAGGGFLLGLSLSFDNRNAEAAGAGDFTPNAFIRIEGNGQIVLTMPYVEM